MQTPRRFGPLLVVGAFTAMATTVVPAACFPSVTGAPCSSNDNCPTGQHCVDGLCQAGSGGAGDDGGSADAGWRGESSADDSCFDLADNDGDLLVDCADPDCDGVLCRPDAGACDLVEVCTNGACPADQFLASDVVCRPSASACDLPESCSGTSPTCPTDRFAPSTTSCAGPTCTAGTFVGEAFCDGDGGCVAPASSSCNGYQCNGSVCRTTCATDADCLSTHFCNESMQCQPKKANGIACTTAMECVSSFCADGVCCDRACTGICEACNGSVSGECRPHAAGTDPENACGPYTCDGAGACRMNCTGQAPCTNYCKASHHCSGGACIPDKMMGTCSNSCECTSGFCADGYCCNSACAGPCQACDVVGAEGTCTPRANGTDPENGCGQFTCNGAGACYTACSPAGSCPASCKSTAYCTASGTCGPDIGDGQPCTQACQCGSGVCGSFYRDLDGDGFGAGAASMFCGSMPPGGYSASNADCDDASSAIRPTATEIAGDEIDQNCDGRELCFVDADDDGYRLTTTALGTDTDCADPGEARAGEPTGDCCDTDANAKPSQAAYFTMPHSCGGALDYDYNCDGVETKQYIDINTGQVVCQTGSPPVCVLENPAGWTSSPIPDCGVTRSYRACNTSNCSTWVINLTQSCR